MEMSSKFHFLMTFGGVLSDKVGCHKLADNASLATGCDDLLLVHSDSHPRGVGLP